MFKKFFLILFILQTLATSVWGAVGVPNFTPSEQIEMSIMHHVMHLDTATMSISKNASMDMKACMDNSPKKSSCSDCDMTNCHSLLCASVHASPTFNLVDTFKLNMPSSQPDISISLDETLTTTSFQPEIPPPNKPSI